MSQGLDLSKIKINEQLTTKNANKATVVVDILDMTHTAVMHGKAAAQKAAIEWIGRGWGLDVTHQPVYLGPDGKEIETDELDDLTDKMKSATGQRYRVRLNASL